MSVELLLPKLGVEMESAVVTEWLADEGAEVAAEQVVLTVETEKVSFEVAAPAAGLLHQVAESGEEYEVGALLAVVATDAAELATLGAGDGAAASPPPAATTEDAATPAGSAPAATATAPAVATANGDAPARVSDRDASAARRRGEPLASPLARRIADEQGIALSTVEASGPGGKILRRDVERAATSPTPAASAATGPSMSPAEPVVVKLGATRKTIARRMHASLQETAQMTDVREYDVSALVELRRGLAANVETLGYKVSFTDLFVRAAAIALGRVPDLNATFADGELLQYPQANIGVAVAVPDGLVVPVVRGAGDCSLRELHERMVELIDRARERRISAEDIAEGTFTVTNIGSYGSEFGTPVLNPPQVAILGTGVMQRKPVVRDAEIVVGTTMYLSLTVDHRVIDGEVAGRFLNAMGELFAEPSLILAG